MILVSAGHDERFVVMTCIFTGSLKHVPKKSNWITELRKNNLRLDTLQIVKYNPNTRNLDTKDGTCKLLILWE